MSIVAICLAVLATGATGASGDRPVAGKTPFQVNQVHSSVVDAKALTIDGSFGQAINGKSFQQDAIVTHGCHQYIAYYDEGRHVCVARRMLPRGSWQIIRLADYRFEGNDAHNTISMGICPGDGTIHLAFDHHVHPLHYRRSVPNVANLPECFQWSASLFGPVQSELESGQPIRVTYPRFLQTPAGGLQFFYRRGSSGNGDRMMVDYDPCSGFWKDTRQIDSRQGVYVGSDGKESRSRCSYPNGYTYGPFGKVHVTWAWREGGGAANHDLMYAYSQDGGRTWRNNSGEVLAEPPGVDSSGVKVVDIEDDLGLLNTHGQAVDSCGRIHTVVKHCTEETLQAAGSYPGEHRWGPREARRYHHYWRDASGRWHHRQLPGVVGNRPKLFFDAWDNAVLIFTDAPRSRGIKSSQGNLKIMAASRKSQWQDWQLIASKRGPFVNEMLADPVRWQRLQCVNDWNASSTTGGAVGTGPANILSILVQDLPEKAHQPTPLRVLDFAIRRDE